MGKLTVKHIEDLEAQCTPLQRANVIDRVKALGWSDPRSVPLYVWQDIYLDELRAK